MMTNRVHQGTIMKRDLETRSMLLVL